MSLTKILSLTAALGVFLVATPQAFATPEVCGDGLDNDSDGYADNGCYPQGVTGICESPLSCRETGAVAPLTGQLVYREPADLAPRVPYGPSITLQRSFMSQYDPGYNDPADTDYKAPLGYGWHHNFMSWVSDQNVASDEAMLHSVTGQEILFTRISTTSPYDTYEAQAGAHFDYLRRHQSTDQWELRTLTGQVYSYDDSSPGALTTIADSVGNEVTIDYHGGSNCYVNQVKRVTDASGHKFLEFSYDTGKGKECMLQNVDLYSKDGATETLRAGVEYLHGDQYTLTRVVRAIVSGGSTEVARYYGYDANHKLTTIDDGASDDIAQFYYLDATAGKIARIETGSGVVGYQYQETETSCVGSGTTTKGTCVYFNRTDAATTCSNDTPCGSYSCGGQTTVGSGSTGACFRASRWLDISSTNEDVIDAVSASCATCGSTDAYEWDTGTSGEKLELDGTENAEGTRTSYERNSNGLVTIMVTNDDDFVATTVPGGARAVYYFYGNATYPGLVTEVRRLSELQSSGCDASTTTNCKRTIYTYTADGRIDTRQEKGFTLDAVGATVAYDFTTDWDYDTEGRVTKFKGPRTDTSYDVIDYTYHTTGVLLDGYLHETKRQKATSTFITSSREDYDFWGHAIALENPNGDYTCLTYHDERNVLTERRVAMNGQTSCVTVKSKDLVTAYAYDLGKKPTQVTKPFGNCMFTEYDSWARVSTMKSRDDCNSASTTGDNIEYTYASTIDADGKPVTVSYKDSGTATYEMEMTYTDAGRLATRGAKGISNTRKTLAYEDDGQLKSISDESFGKTDFEHDVFGQIDLIKKLLVGSTTRDWDLTPGTEQNLPTKVQDPNSQAIDWVWDDRGLKAKQVTPESGTTLYLHDAAGNLTSRIENYGGADEMTNAFSYDSLNRLVEADYGDADCFTLGDAEIAYTYDTAASCPTGTCVNSQGRLAKVETQMACDDTEGDDSFDQQTFYGYDYAGRLVNETIEDDGGRSAPQYYSYYKNGNPHYARAPSGAYMGWTYNLANGTENSDADKPSRLWRNSGGYTDITTDGRWNPFGPMESYQQYNQISGSATYVEADFTWDKAYRIGSLQYKNTAGTNLLDMDHTYDADGNLAGRDVTGSASLPDSYYTYDGLDRVTYDCGAASCTDTYEKSTLAFNVSGDRTSIRHDNGNSYVGDMTYLSNYTSGTGKLSTVTYNDGSARTINYAFDARGNRLYDDDTQWTRDRRDYTYDARNNLITVAGKFTFDQDNDIVHDYTLTNAYDHKNRRVFKSFYDETDDTEAQWFFYYDFADRLFEIKHTPDTASSSTYSLYQFYYIGDRPVAYWQVDYPSATTTKRYIHSDDQNRPNQVYSWSNATSIVWQIRTDLYGWDGDLFTNTVFQPLRFPGQYADDETMAVKLHWGIWLDEARPPLSYNWFRTYDPFTGGYLQVDPKVDDTWDAYRYAGQNPVMMVDPTGLSKWSEAVEKLNTVLNRFGSWMNDFREAKCSGGNSHFWSESQQTSVPLCACVPLGASDEFGGTVAACREGKDRAWEACSNNCKAAYGDTDVWLPEALSECYEGCADIYGPGEDTRMKSDVNDAPSQGVVAPGVPTSPLPREQRRSIRQGAQGTPFVR